MASSTNENAISGILDTWQDHRPQAAFEKILNAYKENHRLDSKELTELTGVRKIEKIVEGKGDEIALFINDKYLVLSGYVFTLRLFEIETLKSNWFSRPAFPITDKCGIVFYKKNFIYYMRTIDNLLTLYEYNIEERTSKPLGNLPKALYSFRFDNKNALLQFADKNQNPVMTFDLNNRTTLDTLELVPERKSIPLTQVNAFTGYEKLTLEFDDTVISMPYPRQEFLAGIKPDLLYLDRDHPSSILVDSKWYPGLKLIIDLKSERIYKVFIPHWLDPNEHGSWYLIDNRLFIWRKKGEKAGLYQIDLDKYPQVDEFVLLLEEYSLTHPKSGIGEAQNA